MMSQKLVCLMVLAGFSIAAAGCSSKPKTLVKNGELVDSSYTPKVETDDYIEFDGIGAADQSISNKTQKRSLSEAAARKVAEEKLLAYLKGQQIDATTTVEQAITTDQKIQGVVSNTLRGVQVVRRDWIKEDDGCVMVIRLDKKKFMDQIKEVRRK